VLVASVLPTGEAAEELPAPLAAPTIQATLPPDQAINVSLAGLIEVGFSETVNQSTLAYAIQPSLSVTETWPQPDVLRLTPVTAFPPCTAYSVQVFVRDLDEGLALTPGPVPNPWTFMTACPQPFLVATVPRDGELNVPMGTTIVVLFSEPINVTAGVSLILTPSPPVGNDQWSLNNTRLTRTTTLTPGATYTATVNATDVDGEFLVPGGGLAPNPWTFTLNEPPTVFAPRLSASGCLDAGISVGISWSMSDDVSPPEDLTVTLSFRDVVGTRTITGPTTGFPSPANYVWSLPATDVSTNVTIEVRDSAGGVAWNWSETFRIDTGAPSVLSTIPADGAVDVPYQSMVTIGFSEAMNRTTVVIVEDPDIGGGAPTWVSEDRQLLIGAGMMDRQTYTITIRGTARDTCGAGHPMAADFQFSFTTGRAPPAAPGGLFWTDRQETSLTLAWEPVTEFATGRPIPLGMTVTYVVRRNGELVGSTTASQITDTGLRPSTGYTYRVIAYADGLQSAESAALDISTLRPFFTTLAGQFLLLVLAVATGVIVIGWGQIRRYRHRTIVESRLQEEVHDLVVLTQKARTEPDPVKRRGFEDQVQARFLGLVAGPEGENIDPRLEVLYRALAEALVQSPEVDVAHGRSLVDARLGPLVPGFAAQGAAYRLLSEAEASVSSDLFRGLPESGRKALLLVYFYSLEEYLSHRLRVLVPAGATILLGDRGHINVRRRGWEQPWAGLSLGNLLYLLDHNRAMFLADSERWEEDVEPFVHQTVDARNRTAHPSREAPPLDRVRELIYTSFRLLESVLKAPKGVAS